MALMGIICAVKFTPRERCLTRARLVTFQTLRDRLTRAKHPYLLPVLDADLLDLPQGYPAVVVISPCSHAGSLRDILYKVSACTTAKYAGWSFLHVTN